MTTPLAFSLTYLTCNRLLDVTPTLHTTRLIARHSFARRIHSKLIPRVRVNRVWASREAFTLPRCLSTYRQKCWYAFCCVIFSLLLGYCLLFFPSCLVHVISALFFVFLFWIDDCIQSVWTCLSASAIIQELAGNVCTEANRHEISVEDLETSQRQDPELHDLNVLLFGDQNVRENLSLTPQQAGTAELITLALASKGDIAQKQQNQQKRLQKNSIVFNIAILILTILLAIITLAISYGTQTVLSYLTSLFEKLTGPGM